MVLLALVRMAPLPDSLIIAMPPPVVDSVTVPPPVRLTPALTLRNVLLAVAFTRIAPVLLIVPTRIVVLLFGPV